MRVDNTFGKRRSDAADQIEEQEAQMSHGIFDIVPENPEVKHVAAEVQETSVQEHRRDQRVPGPGNSIEASAVRVVEEIPRDEGECEDDGFLCLLAETELPEEYDDA